MIKALYFRKLVMLASLLCVSSFAQAGHVVIVHKDNNDTLNKQQLTKIFLGKMKKFPSGSSILPINHKSSSSAKTQFDKDVLGKSNSQIKAYWSKRMFSGKGKPPKEVGSDNDVKSIVAGDVAAIGYIDEANVDDSVKVVFKF